MERCDRRICNGITKELAKLYTNKSSLSNKVLAQEYTESDGQTDVFFELTSVNRHIARKEKQLAGLEIRDKRIRLRTKREADPVLDKNRRLRQASYAKTGPKRQNPPYVKDFFYEQPEMEEVEY